MTSPLFRGRARMPEVERPEFCRTQNKQSVHKTTSVLVARCNFEINGKIASFENVPICLTKIKYKTSKMLLCLPLFPWVVSLTHSSNVIKWNSEPEKCYPTKGSIGSLLS